MLCICALSVLRSSSRCIASHELTSQATIARGPDGLLLWRNLVKVVALQRREMLISDAQQDNRRAYVGGGPGAFISGVLWVVAALVLKHRGVGAAFAFIFFGGMLIFPLTTFVSRQLFKREAASKSNSLGRVVPESTVAMIGGLFAAWLFLSSKPTYVFPLAAIAVGTHYAAFCTVFGDKLFWVLACLITAVGVLDILGYVRLPGGPALAVGILEIAFGILLTARDRQARPFETPQV